MKNRLLKQAGREYSEKRRAIALLFLAPIFLGFLPYFIFWLGGKIDQWLGWRPILSSPENLVLAFLMILPAMLLALWSIYSQFTLGRGTPVPLMATQKLVVQPPFSYCRNPMALGTMIAYTGVGILFRSAGAVVVVLIFSGLLLIYIKLFEEKEMESRFGEEYLRYKKQTPFLIPHFVRKS